MRPPTAVRGGSRRRTCGDFRILPRTDAGRTGPADPTPGVIPGIVLDNRYRLEELLGRGATAEVYRGTDELLGRAVAVKVFHRGIGDATSVARQRTEMQVLAKLHHPHLVIVYDAKLGVDTGDGTGRGRTTPT